MYIHTGMQLLQEEYYKPAQDIEFPNLVISN